MPVVPDEYSYAQSGSQAFFFISKAQIDGNLLERGDWLIAYHKNVIVGSRMWSGEFTDVPAMGFESDNINTAGYSKVGGLIDFKVYDGLVYRPIIKK